MIIVDQSPMSCDLARKALRSFGELRLHVIGSSMLPAIRQGDVVHVVNTAPEDVQAGDIVLFARGGRLITHRVIEAGSRIITRGDRNRRLDAPVERREFLGRVSAVLRDGRAVPFKPGLRARAAAAICRGSDFCTKVVMKLSAIFVD